MNDEQAALTIAQLVHRSSLKHHCSKHSLFKRYSTLTNPLLQHEYREEEKIPMIDITNPPIVPAANGNQNASLSVPTIKGINQDGGNHRQEDRKDLCIPGFGISSQSRHSGMTPPDGIVFVEDIDTGVHRNTT